MGELSERVNSAKRGLGKGEIATCKNATWLDRFNAVREKKP
jgi:hypothetical protein